MALSPEILAKINALREQKALKDAEAKKKIPPPVPTEVVQAIQEINPAKVLEIRSPEQSFLDSLATTIDRYGNVIHLNERQQEFVRTVAQGKSCVLIGAAGTGKTTCQAAATRALIQGGIAGIISGEGHKTLKSGKPGIVICAYTRRAATNIRRSLPPELQENCMTIHKLLQYAPVQIEVEDKESGIFRNSMRFEPQYHAGKPLPSSIRAVIMEEASMISCELHKQLDDALPHNPQRIYLGDIQQLPPTMGTAILGFKLLELPVVELTEVYRQALESPILSLAWKFLRGEEIPQAKFQELNVPGKLTIRPWKRKVSPEVAVGNTAYLVNEAIDAGAFDIEQDMVLLPFNKGFGTIEFNKKVANHLARKLDRTTYHIRAGRFEHYFSIGDRALFDKEDCTIEDIYPNPDYTGKHTRIASKTLDYWGNDSSDDVEEFDLDAELSDEQIEKLLNSTAGDTEESRKNAASHCIEIYLPNQDVRQTLSSSGDVGKLLLGYALTVHKAQGSEWRNVWFLLHHTHSVLLQRELLYTAVTRAKEQLVILCEPDSLVRGVRSQRIKGNTLAEKAEFFKGKADKQAAESLED